MCTSATRHPRRSAQVDVPLKPRLYRHPHGVCAVDAEYLYPGHAAAHIIEDGGRAAFVDVGTNASVPYLLAALAELGIARAAVDYVLLTHVHLDHAGGAGRLMQELPNAVAVLHPRGAPHMIDPSRLIEGSRAVYGERLEQLYGQLLPIPAARVRVVEDGERVRADRPESVYLMHFSRVPGVPRLGELLKPQVRELARIARAHAQDPDPAAGIRAAMRALWLDLAHGHGCALSDGEIEKVLEGDLELNTQGLMVWLKRLGRH